MNGNIEINLNNELLIKNYRFNSEENNIRFTSIIVLTYNELEYTKLCIESIRKFTPEKKYEIIVVDNCSIDGTVEWLKQQDDLKVIYNNQNYGFPKGCNQGIEIAMGENILLLNNDVIVTPNWLDNLNTALWSNELIGAVGAISNKCSYYQQINVLYSNLQEMFSFSQKNNISDNTKWDYRTKLIGLCMLIKKEALDKVGLLDESFSPGNYEDDDISFRMISAGYKLLLCRDVFIHHFGSVSFKKDILAYSNILEKNFHLFKNKWGFNPKYSTYIRFDLIDKIIEETDAKIKVLEVGCGTGATLLEIKSRYKNSDVFGIEICENAANIASNNCTVFVGNVEEIENVFEENNFDYIILGDVLEHLYDPWKVLDKLDKFLKPGGFIISSIPNIMHISVISSLLNGKFSYEDAGILDFTHIRFFTLTEIIDLLSEYKILDLNANQVGLTNDQEKLVELFCELYGDDKRSEYLAYQYIVKCQKRICTVNDEYNKKVKYLLMRVDNSIHCEDDLNKLITYYTQDKDKFLLITDNIIKNDIINKEIVLNRMGVMAFEKSEFELSLSLLMLSFEMNSNFIETIYNLCTILNFMGEYKIALNIMNNKEEIIKLDKDLLDLQRSLQEKINEK